MPKEVYFFNEEDPDELAKRLMDKVIDFQDHVLLTGKAAQWKKNKDMYENKFYTEFANFDILDAGEQGELLVSSLNDFRNISRHILNPLFSYQPDFTVTATNNDPESMRAADIGKQIVQYYEKIKRYNKIDNDVCEYAWVYGDGFHIEEFNPDIMTDGLSDKGDFDAEAASVWDVFYDFLRKGKKDWYIFRRRRNKYDVAASLAPEIADKILAMKPFYLSDRYFKDLDFVAQKSATDDIYVYSAYHRATPACPQGKYVLFAGEGDNATYIYSSDNPYKKELPVFHMQAGRYIETAFGFTDANILRAPQEQLNNLYSMMVTNAQSAIKDIWSPTGEEVTIEELSSGRNHIQSRTKPEVLDLYTGDKALLEFIGFLRSSMETLSAQNSVIRGNVDNLGFKSGIALQTVIAIGQQFTQQLQIAKRELFEEINTFRLATLQKVADVQRIIDVVGRSHASNVIAFTRDDIKSVSRVVVKEINPIANTYSGRIEIGQDLLSKNIIGMTDFFQLVHTGNIDAATDSKKAMVDYAAMVKESLLNGEQVQAVSGADHAYVIKEIQSLLLNINFTKEQANQQKIMNIQQFINQSMDLMRSGDEISGLIYGGQAPTPIPQQMGASPLSGNGMQPSPNGANMQKAQAAVSPQVPVAA